MTVSDDQREPFRSQLRELGFDDVRFVRIADWATHASRLAQWLDGGMHADMHWMERSAAKRVDPELVLPGARSIVMLGVNYWAGAAPAQAGARWARYALYEDYHDTLKPALVEAGRLLERNFGVTSTDYRYYVDTGPVLERGWAARSGLGFVGKNAMLISRDYGNWTFIAAILTRVELAPDEPIRNRNWAQRRIEDSAAPVPVGLLCGKCSRCIEACPTDAFAEPGVVDARRCISYQTIENKGVIPHELRAGIGDRIYGCDVCLEVCPWNRFAQEGRQMLLAARHEIAELPLREILTLNAERFAEVFRRTPIKRLKLVGLLRNACIVAGNSGDVSLLPEVVALASSHESPLVRAHAVWAVNRLGGAERLVDARNREQDPLVLAEYDAERTAATKVL